MQPTNMRIRRAAVVDESVLQRARAVQLLSEELPLRVVHESATVGHLLSWLRTVDRTGWPHLIVLTVPSGPSAGSDAALAALREAGMRLVLLSPLDAWPLVRRVSRLRAEGVVSTGDDEAELLSVVQAVIAGETRIAPRANAALKAPRPGPRLSMQEERVLELYSCGLTIAEVAERIGVRHDTARKYLQRVRDKFTTAGRPARTKLDLARIAWADGYADPDQSCDEAASGAA